MASRALRPPPDHALRRELANEIHARPAEPVESPARATYVAVIVGAAEREAELSHLAALCARFGVATPPPDANHFGAQLGELRLKWERHTEFTGYGFYVTGSGEFDAPASSLLPAGWLEGIPGETIAAAHTILVKDDRAAAERWFSSSAVVGAEIGDGAALAFTDLRIGDDGYERFVIVDRTLTPRQAGRMAKRLFEIEAYRMMALLALPLARARGRVAAATEEALAALTERMAGDDGGDEPLLANLTQLAAKVESAIDTSEYRFSASRAYYDLVRARIDELRERAIPGMQTLGNFMTGRLAPAMATCLSTSQRLRDLSERVARASGLLSTRVEIARERQNQRLLESMERRARLQLRLQQTVEGLSVAAITYYVAGLVGYVAKGAHAADLPVEPEIAIALSIPIILVLVALALRRARKKLGHDEAHVEM